MSARSVYSVNRRCNTYIADEVAIRLPNVTDSTIKHVPSELLIRLGCYQQALLKRLFCAPQSDDQTALETNQENGHLVAKGCTNRRHSYQSLCFSVASGRHCVDICCVGGPILIFMRFGQRQQIGLDPCCIPGKVCPHRLHARMLSEPRQSMNVVIHGATQSKERRRLGHERVAQCRKSKRNMIKYLFQTSADLIALRVVDIVFFVKLP